jgi:hypothetical protein
MLGRIGPLADFDVPSLGRIMRSTRARRWR